MFLILKLKPANSAGTINFNKIKVVRNCFVLTSNQIVDLRLYNEYN